MCANMGKRLYLIVDDESYIRRYLKAVLQCGGIQCVEAKNAFDAVELLQGRADEIDLLITDIQMPGQMDGADLATLVKSSFPTLPVILISGHAEKVPNGFALVQKPFSPETILEAVQQVMVTARYAGSAREQ